MKKAFLLATMFIILVAISCGKDKNDNSGTSGTNPHQDVIIPPQDQGGGGNTGGDTDANSNTDSNVNTDNGAPKKGLLHGWGCTKDDQCKYHECYEAPNITNRKFKICTKDCTIVSNGTCAKDDTEDVHFVPVRWGKNFYPEETLTCYCLPACHSLEDCKKIDPRYNSCSYPPVGTHRVCRYLPPGSNNQ